MSPRRRNHYHRNLTGLVIVLSLVLVGLIVLSAALPGILHPATEPIEPSVSLGTESTQPSIPPDTKPTQPPVTIESAATLAATGDILMHGPVIRSGLMPDGDYDFSSIFTYFADYVTAADYAVSNLETTLAGLDNGYEYSGYPQFNCPDSIVSGLKNAGFDMLLTSNNHSYDTHSIGLRRTQQVIANAGLSHLGTKPTADEPNYLIATVNGIRIGMLCYTYETDPTAAGKSPNDHKMTPEDAQLINTFDYSNLPLFYAEMAQNMEDLTAAEVDAVVMFIHWGSEYQTRQNALQTEIAQNLCDLGVDVIVGGHPHVVQPVELLTAADGSHKTVCLYSMGNAVSNQRISQMNLKTGHTEDGVLFSVTFTKYSDGTVILSDANLLPLWVNHRANAQGKWIYPILPLDKQIEDWKTQFDLTDTMLKNAQASYDRTMAIVGDGIQQTQEYLAQQKAATEAALGMN
ncbi:MAG: CapA family protein [Ruminococcaceae bacterium]|nr:CapA family protein [Oscillospiraceae bacterium]